MVYAGQNISYIFSPYSDGKVCSSSHGIGFRFVFGCTGSGLAGFEIWKFDEPSLLCFNGQLEPG